MCMRGRRESESGEGTALNLGMKAGVMLTELQGTSIDANVTIQAQGGKFLQSKMDTIVN